MAVYVMEKEVFDSFVSKVSSETDFIAPVMDDESKFAKVSDAKEIWLEKNTYFPPKEFFFRKKEVLFSFDGNNITVPALEKKEKVIFGIRRCDLNAIKHQDIAFLEGDVEEPFYKAQREGTVLVGYHCPHAYEYCFCGSLKLEDFHDLMFFDRKDHYLVEVGSEKGREFISRYYDFFIETNDKITDKDRVIPGADRLDNPDISGLYDHPDWKKGVDLCLSCGACNMLCPTCYCFDVKDELKIDDLKKGDRVRTWAGCQFKEFTRVAGNHVFRDTRESRFKHRIFHQLQWFMEKNGVNLCVGCGRCISGCPTRIDFVDIINEMS